MAYAGKQHLIAICSKLQGQHHLKVVLSIKQQAQKNRNSLCGWESNDIRSTELIRVLTVLGDANASLHKRLPRYKSAHTWCFHLKKLVTEL